MNYQARNSVRIYLSYIYNSIKTHSMKYFLFALASLILMNSEAQTLDSVNYKIDGKVFKAYYALPTVVSKRTKTVLIVHEWWGLNEYPKQRALKLAQEGTIGFCIDMYGKGVIAENPAEAQKLATPFYENPALAYKHFMAGYNEAIKIKGVDTSKMAAIGYCFGGSMVLNAAKMGAPIDLAVSFHGGLAGIPVDKNKLKATILVCHGAADSFVPDAEVAEFKKQMEENEINMTFISYPNATHAFTNPESTAVGQKFGMPISYNEAADIQSWEDFNKALRKMVY